MLFRWIVQKTHSRLCRAKRSIRRTTLGVSGYFGIRRSKVFAIGFNKTGSSSIHALFLEIGLDSYHGTEWRSKKPRSWLLNSRDAFGDGIPRDLNLLDHNFPNSHFILQVRNLEPWLFSRLAHIRRAKDRGDTNFAEDWDETEYAIAQWIKKRNSYHLSVLRKFQERPLLIIDYTRDPLAARKVASFLQVDRDVSKPWVYRSARKPLQAHQEMVKSVFEELGITDEDANSNILARSLLPPSLKHLPHDTTVLNLKTPKDRQNIVE